MKQFIYADNAATTKLDKAAFEAMLPWLNCEYGNASQLYSFARKPKKAIADARQTIASCIGALPEEIYFTSGGTESDNWAIKSAVFADYQKREIITSSFEHHAVLHSCAALEILGYPVNYISPNENGCVLPDNLSKMINDSTRLVSIMFANNEIGVLQPVAELASISHAHGALFHTDAVQAVGHVPIDVRELGIDMLSASAHKFNGSKGIGFLYVRSGIEIAPYMDGGAQEAHHRAGTENVASIVGMAVALKANIDELRRNEKHLRNLETMLLTGLQNCGVEFTRNGDGNFLPGLVSLSFPGKDGEAILHRMDLMGICISTGSACNSEKTQVSHVLKAIGLPDELAQGTIRISLGRYNTVRDVEKIVACLKKILG